MGLRVPDDLSVVGFDNVPEAANADPPLTTLAQPLQQMGAEAVRLLLALLDGDASEEHIRCPASLVTRASTAPPRSQS
jgi:LacI family transcriptional regulator